MSLGDSNVRKIIDSTGLTKPVAMLIMVGSGGIVKRSRCGGRYESLAPFLSAVTVKHLSISYYIE